MQLFYQSRKMYVKSDISYENKCIKYPLFKKILIDIRLGLNLYDSIASRWFSSYDY